jgi:GNAT superfamily N-acetyltransferase
MCTIKMSVCGSIEIVKADLSQPNHQQAAVVMIDAYCCDPMANGRPLEAEVRSRLIPALREQPLALVLLAFDGERPVGVACCFGGFSTFAARPTMNLHDLMVLDEYRGRGIGRQLLQAVEEHARAAGCCKVTLEVLEHNPARRLYVAAGYSPPHYDNEAGAALFLTKSL